MSETCQKVISSYWDEMTVELQIYEYSVNSNGSFLGNNLYWRHMAGKLPAVVPLGLVACAGTVLLILGVDIPLYIERWRIGKRSGLRSGRGLEDPVVRRQRGLTGAMRYFG